MWVRALANSSSSHRPGDIRRRWMWQQQRQGGARQYQHDGGAEDADRGVARGGGGDHGGGGRRMVPARCHQRPARMCAPTCARRADDDDDARPPPPPAKGGQPAGQPAPGGRVRWRLSGAPGWVKSGVTWCAKGSPARSTCATWRRRRARQALLDSAGPSRVTTDATALNSPAIITSARTVPGGSGATLRRWRLVESPVQQSGAPPRQRPLVSSSQRDVSRKCSDDHGPPASPTRARARAPRARARARARGASSAAARRPAPRMVVPRSGVWVSWRSFASRYSRGAWRPADAPYPGARARGNLSRPVSRSVRGHAGAPAPGGRSARAGAECARRRSLPGP